MDAGPVAGYLWHTNLVEGTEVFELGDFLGNAYRGYRVICDKQEIGTNHWYQVNFTVRSPDPGQPVISRMTVMYYSPHSPAGSLEGATVVR